jgi:hypothetical protein
MDPVAPIDLRTPVDGYQPGVCNIGPAEIARRRNFGHVGLAATLVLYAVLVALGVPSWIRFLVAIPAAGAASGYLQAYSHFCAGFGGSGVYDFGAVGTTIQVTDAEALAADRAKSRRISLGSLLIGVLVGLVAVLLPV